LHGWFSSKRFIWSRCCSILRRRRQRFGQACQADCEPPIISAHAFDLAFQQSAQLCDFVRDMAGADGAMMRWAVHENAFTPMENR